MLTAKLKHTRVFVDKGSLNQIIDITVKTIAPTAKPIKRDGHSCPSK